ncbi:hypothetical protein Hanom_Chr10g00885691 [Helianthus anomalus]
MKCVSREKNIDMCVVLRAVADAFPTICGGDRPFLVFWLTDAGILKPMLFVSCFVLDGMIVDTSDNADIGE